MIRKIILFTKGIETLWYFSAQMGKTFEELGYEVFYFDQCASYRSLADLLLFAEPGVTAAVSFNFDGCKGEEYFIDRKGIHLFDDREIPMINIVVDHPFSWKGCADTGRCRLTGTLLWDGMGAPCLRPT